MSALKELGVSLRIPADKQDDPEIRRELAQLDALLTANPLLSYNNPELNPKRVHDKQLEFNRIKCEPLGVKGLIAGSRSGKTTGCLADDVIQAVPRDLLPEHLLSCKKWDPPFHVWIGAPKYAKHVDTILPILRKLIPKEQLIDGNFDKSYKAQDRILKLVCGSTFGFKTYDQDIDAWASAEVHRIHWDEEPNGENGRRLRQEARARLISTEGEEIISMTPLLGFSWVYDEVWEIRNTDPTVTVVQMGMADNPWNSPKMVENFAAKIPTEEERRARLFGEFVHFGGTFFDEFREDLHVVEPPTKEAIKQQEVVIGIDPGMRHTGVTYVAFDNDNSALVFAEFDGEERVVPEIAAEIKRLNAEWGIKDPTYVIDPSARNRSAINADQVEAAYAREEIYCQHGQNDRAAGILELKRRFQAVDAAGKPCPSLLLSRRCPKLIQQVERYRRDEKSADEWAAIKQDEFTRFDLLDSLRYAVMVKAWESLEDEPITRRPAYQPNFQPPYSTEHFPQPSPPNGAFT